MHPLQGLGRTRPAATKGAPSRLLHVFCQTNLNTARCHFSPSLPWILMSSSYGKLNGGIKGLTTELRKCLTAFRPDFSNVREFSVEWLLLFLKVRCLVLTAPSYSLFLCFCLFFSFLPPGRHTKPQQWLDSLMSTSYCVSESPPCSYLTFKLFALWGQEQPFCFVPEQTHLGNHD